MKRLLLALLLLPALAQATCENVANTHWVAKSDDSIHSLTFVNGRDLRFATISKAEAYRTFDPVNANEFYGTSTYYQYDCNVVFELPHLDAQTTQIYIYIEGNAGVGFALEKGKEKVYELSR